MLTNLMHSRLKTRSSTDLYPPQIDCWYKPTGLLHGFWDCYFFIFLGLSMFFVSFFQLLLLFTVCFNNVRRLSWLSYSWSLREEAGPPLVRLASSTRRTMIVNNRFRASHLFATVDNTGGDTTVCSVYNSCGLGKSSRRPY